MKRCTLVVALGLSMGLLGCQRVCERTAAPRARELGKGRTTLARVVDVRRVALGQLQTTDKVLRLPDIRGAGRTWRIFVGPNPGQRSVRFCYTHSSPDIFVEDGWAYIEVDFGIPPSTQPVQWGEARTSRISGTAEGTRFIVQEEDDVHRVILLPARENPVAPPGSVRVELDEQPATAEYLRQAGTYFEVADPNDRDLLPLLNVADSGTVTALVDYVESVAGTN
jgi:hypothetical protein